MKHTGAGRPVKVGLEVCLETPPPILHDASFGLLMNQASVDQHFRYAHHVLADRFPGQLRALFSPQHGLWGEQQDNMVESPHGFDQQLGVPVYSLYGDTRQPTPDMLDGIDVLVVDLQDVGARVYTFIWTVSLCLEVCARANTSVLVLDRPNPLGGELVEGPCLNPEYASFVGRAAIPMRHGLTMGELALAVNDLLNAHAEVHVLPMEGWQRWMQFADTGRAWIPPSPNLPRLEGVQVYPGQVLIEGTQLSEGRGTTTPFELCGAPFVEPLDLRHRLCQFDLPGVEFRPVRFVPTFQKHQGKSCGGLSLHVTDTRTFRPYRTSLAILACVHRLWPHAFQWLPPPYEYEREKMPIDILTGDSIVREHVENHRMINDEALSQLANGHPEAWQHLVTPHRLYEPDETTRRGTS